MRFVVTQEPLNVVNVKLELKYSTKRRIKNALWLTSVTALAGVVAYEYDKFNEQPEA